MGEYKPVEQNFVIPTSNSTYIGVKSNYSYYDIETLDATASIESFNASLLLKYLSTKDIKAACEFAVLCEVITCQKLGGPGSLPTFKQIKDFVSENQLDERLIK